MVEDLPMKYAMMAHHAYENHDDDLAWNMVNTSLELEPTLAGALFLKGVIALARGDYKTGWPLFEYRCARKDARNWGHRYTDRPMWGGDVNRPCRLLLWAEEGYGDTIQMLRFVRSIPRTFDVVLEVQGALVTLCKNSFPWIDVRGVWEKDLEFDLHCSLLSLPYLFKVTTRTIPTLPYLVPVSDFDPILPAKKGICWKGATNAIPVEALSPVTDAHDFLNLQVESNSFGSFAETAAVVSKLDMVLTVDTALAHLSGALGKETWVILSRVSDWRWGRHGTTTPWYPSMRLFRERDYESRGAMVLDIKRRMDARDAQDE